ncbi:MULTISPECIES: Uma2 family endonuclease [unclassified Microcoleus]|uniref:Uma2 family endonuclease n=1 Tax=unclassified Microcoleus TaxID=2642155 RepID=UPI002FD18CC8
MTVTDVRLWTVAEYRRMTETGILNSDERVELIDGQIISMSAKNPPHAATNLCAADYLRSLLAGLALIRIQDPVTLSINSEPEPDIAERANRPSAVPRFSSRTRQYFLINRNS